MDADGLTFACATGAEASAARRAGRAVARVGLGVSRGLPEGRVVSFGLAGALHEGLAIGEVVDATRVVDATGAVLWEGEPLGAAGARAGTLLAADLVIDDPAERRRLHEATGADAVDMESGPLARSGRLAGCLRAISDTPSRTLGPLAGVLRPDGDVSWPRLARAIGRHPRTAGAAISQSRRALRRLQEAAT